jgi:Zn-dependent protease with chaperone function
VDHRPEHGSVLKLALMLAVAGGAASAASIGAAITSIHHSSAATGRVDLAGIPFSYPRVNAAAWILLGLALLAVIAIAIALRAWLRQRRAYQGLLDHLQILGPLNSRASIQVIADPRPQAFCAGYLRPRVYISQAALELLGKEELDAVIAHEQHHQKVRDPLRFASGRILAQALFFVPALRALFTRYADLAELSADGAAVRASGGPAPLASALLTFEASGAGIPPERVDALLGHPTTWRPPWGMMAASLTSLLGLGALVWTTSQGASAWATFNLPFLSSQPCLAMLTVMPLLIVAGLRWRAARRATHPR